MAQESPISHSRPSAWFALLPLLSLVLAITAAADIEEDEYARLEKAYAAIGGEATAEAAEAAEAPQSAMAKALGDEAYSTRDWHDFFHRYYDGHVLSADHTRFWSALIQENTETTETIGNLTAVAAIEALDARIGQTPPDLDSARLAMGWLTQMASALSGPPLRAVGTIVQDALRADPIDLEPLLTISPDTPPIAVSTGIELSILIAVLVEPDQVPQVLRLPAATQAFWQERHLLLFDNGMLSPQHLASLSSLFGSVPRELHGLTAVLVPEAIGIAPANFSIVPPTTAMMVEVLPMDLLTNPSEFVEGTGQPFAPQFTVNAAMGLMEAIQFQQFSLRPELLQRRDLILSNAGFRNGRYPRRDIDPGVYLQDPGALVPLTSFLWFIDSSAAFNQMLQLFRLEQDQAMDIGLLLADTLSGGSGETLVFNTTVDGIVSSTAGAIRRTPVAPGISYCTGIAVEGSVYTFALGNHGSVETFDVY